MNNFGQQRAISWKRNAIFMEVARKKNEISPFFVCSLHIDYCAWYNSSKEMFPIR